MLTAVSYDVFSGYQNTSYASRPPPYPPPPQFGKDKDHLIYDPTDKSIGSVGKQVDRALNDPVFRSQVEQQISSNEGTTFELEIDYFNGSYVIDSTGAKQKLAQLVVEGEARQEVSVIPLKRANYGPADLLHGAGDHMGQPIQVTWTEESDGRMVLGVKLGEPENPESGKAQLRKDEQ